MLVYSIASKEVSFFRHAIQMLPERWDKVIVSDELYFVLREFKIYYIILSENGGGKRLPLNLIIFSSFKQFNT